MSRVTFAGEGAGLGKVQKNGDRSSPYNYDLTCQCGAFLGVLGQFRPNASGDRSALCSKCAHLTVVSATGQVKLVAKYDGPKIRILGEGEEKEIGT